MKSAKVNQIFSALILNYNCFCLGLFMGWQASTMLPFTSNTTPLNRPMTSTEISWFGSLASLGGVISNPAIGILLDKLGRKRSVMLMSFMLIMFWTIVTFSRQVEVILASMTLIGFCGSAMLVVPLFISEFSEESIRGTLASGTMIFVGIGSLSSLIIAEYVSYEMTLYLELTTAIIGLILLMILKESPTLLLKKGLREEAKIAVGFYRNCHPNSKIVLLELEKIQRCLSPEDQEMLSSEQMQLTSDSKATTKKEPKSFWKCFKSSRSTQRAFTVAMILMTLCICQGMLIVQMYSKVIFSLAIPAQVMSATWCSVLLCSVGVVAGFFGGYLMDSFGRRSLMLFSCISSGICCIMFGTQIHLRWGPEWLGPVFMYLFCACYSFGSGSVPLVFSSEIFMPDVKSVLSMVVLEWNFISFFITLFVFTPIIAAIGLGPIFYIFSGVCFLTAVFCYFFMPETKGLSVDDIQLLFYKPKNRDTIE